jgi:hypothetical protein
MRSLLSHQGPTCCCDVAFGVLKLITNLVMLKALLLRLLSNGKKTSSVVTRLPSYKVKINTAQLTVTICFNVL